MALDPQSISSIAMQKLQSKGFVIDEKHSKQSVMVQAIVEAVIEAIKNEAEVKVTSGSSAGSYKVS